MKEKLKGRDAKRCITVRSVRPDTSGALGLPLATPEAGRPPVAVQVAESWSPWPARSGGSPCRRWRCTAIVLEDVTVRLPVA